MNTKIIYKVIMKIAVANLSDQKMNAYLKEIAGVCEIEKELTFHIAPQTFATIVTLC